MKLTLVKPPEFGRSDSVEGLGVAGGVPESFVKPVGTLVGPVMAQSRLVLYKILERNPVDPGQFADERDATLLQLRQQRAIDRNELMLDSVVTTLISEGRLKTHKDTLGRLLASYTQR